MYRLSADGKRGRYQVVNVKKRIACCLFDAADVNGFVGVFNVP
jgi:hypothetical protein